LKFINCDLWQHTPLFCLCNTPFPLFIVIFACPSQVFILVFHRKIVSCDSVLTHLFICLLWFVLSQAKFLSLSCLFIAGCLVLHFQDREARARQMELCGHFPFSIFNGKKLEYIVPLSHNYRCPMLTILTTSWLTYLRMVLYASFVLLYK